MPRMVNVRMASLACLILVVGILVVLGVYYNYIVSSIVAIIAVVTIIAVCAILSKNYLRSAILLVFFVAGITVMLLYILCGAPVLCEQYVQLSGSVEGMSEGEYSMQVILGDVKYYLLDDYGNYLSEELTLPGYTIIYVYYYDLHLAEIDDGDTVELRGYINNLYVLQDEIVTYYYKYDYNYTVSSANVYSVVEGDSSIAQKVSDYVLDRLYTYMPDNYGTAYALLLGDKSYMADGQYEIYQDAGIAHLFAVSGMHIGIIVMAVVWILGRCHVNRRYHLWIVSPPLLFYGYLCGFTPSISRAIIMSVVVLLARRLSSGTDLLTSMSIAMIVILLIRPLYLFDVSFVLSFGSVYGIATIGSALMRLVRSKLSNKRLVAVLDIAILSFSISVTTMFLVVQYFGKVSVVGVLTNMIIVPILPLVFIASMLGLLPYMSWLLVGMDYVLSGMSAMATAISAWSWSTVVLPTIGIAVLVWLLLMFVLGGYVNVRGKSKAVLVAVLCVMLTALSLYNVLPHATTDSIQILDSDGIVVVVTQSNSDIVHVVTTLDDDDDMLMLTEVLDTIKYSQLYVYCTDISVVELDNMLLLYQQYSLTKLYYFDAYHNEALYDYGVVIMRIDKDGYTNNGVIVGSIYNGGLIGVQIITDYCCVAILNTDYQYSLYGIVDGQYDCIFCKSDSTMLCASVVDTPILVTKQLYNNNIYGQNRYGTFTITPKGDTITINGSIVP